MAGTPVAGTPAAGALLPYRTAIEPQWIDYNGHLRDAYYGLILSYAIDDVMEQLGLGETYRERTHCTLYTLELHMRYLQEITASDELLVTSTILDADLKRLHVGCRIECGRLSEPAASGEVMLLHVRQAAVAASAPFPEDIERRIRSLRAAPELRAAWGPASRRIEMRRRAAGGE